MTIEEISINFKEQSYTYKKGNNSLKSILYTVTGEKVTSDEMIMYASDYIKELRKTIR